MTRKRSSQINLNKMRKQFAPKPLAVGVAALFLSGCADDRQDALIYQNIDDCVSDNPELADTCRAAYEDALEEARRTGPKYASQRDCEYDFGPNQCNYVNYGGDSFFMPLMAGYMLGNLLSPGRYYTQPMYTSYSPYSRYRYRWLNAGGYDYGDISRKRFKVNRDAFKPKPEVKKTIKRGGFGSSVRAKSSWGSSRKSGWGG